MLGGPIGDQVAISIRGLRSAAQKLLRYCRRIELDGTIGVSRCEFSDGIVGAQPRLAALHRKASALRAELQTFLRREDAPEVFAGEFDALGEAVNDVVEFDPLGVGFFAPHAEACSGFGF